MLTGARRRLRRLDREAGVTLIELLVAMGLSTVLAAITLTMFVVVNNSSAATTDRTVSTAQARSTLQAWTSYLGVADGPTGAGTAAHRIEWVSGSDLLFYASLGNRSGTANATPPTMIWLRLYGSSLVEEQFAKAPGASYADSYPTTPTACRVVVDNVTSATFAAYTPSTADTDFGQPRASTGTGPCRTLPSATQQDNLANTTLAKVTSVSIDFLVSRSDGTQPLEFAATTTLPTLGGS